MLKAPESFFFFPLSLKGHIPCLLLELVFSASQTRDKSQSIFKTLEVKEPSPPSPAPTTPH